MKKEFVSQGAEELRYQPGEAICSGCGTDDVNPALHKLRSYQPQR